MAPQMLLHQAIALRGSEKTRAETAFTKIYQNVQKPEPLSGISRTYEPKTEDGDRLPDESTRVQVNVEDMLRQATAALTRYFDLTATQEWGNTAAAADIVVDGEVLLPAVPVTYLIFLERKLADLAQFVAKLPTLDPAQEWEYDPNSGHQRAKAVRTHRTRKVPRNHVKAAATEKHPAQVDVYFEDEVIGTWTTTRYSGALPVDRVNQLAERVRKLQDAVKAAHSQANAQQVDEKKVGETVLGWLFAA